MFVTNHTNYRPKTDNVKLKQTYTLFISTLLIKRNSAIRMHTSRQGVLSKTRYIRDHRKNMVHSISSHGLGGSGRTEGAGGGDLPLND